MTSQLKQLEGLKRQISVTVLPDDLQKAYQKRVIDFAKQTALKGFRSGKVPLHIVEQRYGKSLLHETAADLIQKTFEQNLMHYQLKIAGSPSIQFDPNNLKKTEPFTYVAKFEIYPEIQLKDLESVDIKLYQGTVSDDDVSAMLIKLKTQHAKWHSVDRPAKLGDRVRIDFEGMMDEKPIEQGSGKDVYLELGSKKMIPGFEEGLVDVNKGDIRKLNIQFPENYHVESLRAKPAVFTITVHTIEEPILPVLDDEFAKKFSFDNVDALKQNIKTRMQSELDAMIHNLLKQNVLNKLIDLNTVEIPDTLIDMEIQNLQNMTRRQLQHHQRDLSEKQIKSLNFPREPYVNEAKKRVALGLLLSKVIELHNIQIDREKVNKKIMEFSAEFPEPEKMAEMYRNNKHMLSEVEALILEDQAVQRLLNKANVKLEEKSYDAIMNIINQEKEKTQEFQNE